MTELHDRRLTAVRAVMAQVASETALHALNRDRLDRFKSALLELAGQPELFSEGDYPSPTKSQVAKTYLLAESANQGPALYLISILPLGPSPIHDHGTFAIIAGLEGYEHNTLYARSNTETGPGKATLRVCDEQILGPCDALALMPQDIHHIDNQHTLPTRHLHLYGTAFEHQTGRLEFDLAAGLAKRITIPKVPVDRSRQVT
ncbi:MAG: hypothetical protein ACO3JV_09325 [Pseudomonadales bacterium]